MRLAEMKKGCSISPHRKNLLDLDKGTILKDTKLKVCSLFRKPCISLFARNY